MLVIACPGQGSQSQGFLTPWIESYPEIKIRLESLSDFCGRDLVRLGTEASEEEIKETSNAQRLIVASSIAVYRTCVNKAPYGVVGHSVGEFAAAAISGILSDEDAIKLVGIRADAMAAASALAPTSMAAILGGDEAEVLAKLSSLGLEAANFNGGGQIVAAGAKKTVEDLVASPPEKARVIELKVAGAFHTHFMASAIEEVKKAVSVVTVSDPQIKIWSNKDGAEVTSGTDFVQSLVTQIANPVRWDMCMKSLNTEGTTVIELPPAGALAGLLKRGAPLVSTVALKSVSDLEKVS